jgi:hypothetical protein
MDVNGKKLINEIAFREFGATIPQIRSIEIAAHDCRRPLSPPGQGIAS